MADLESAVEELRALPQAQTRVLVERLSSIEAVQKSAGGRIEGSLGEYKSSYLDGAVAGELVGPTFGRRGGFTTNSLLRAAGEVGIAGGSIFALDPRERSSVRTADAKQGSSVDFPLWKRPP